MRTLVKSLVPLLLVSLFATTASAQVETYCSATPNSVGPGAAIHWEGGGNLFFARATVDGLPKSSIGIFTYGFGAEETPFGNGLSCISGNRGFLARKRATNGVVTLSLFAEVETDIMGELFQHVGSELHVQYMYRDPRDGGARFNLSNAIRVTLQMGT